MKHIPGNCRTGEEIVVLKLQKYFVEDSDRRSLHKGFTNCSLCLLQIYKEPSGGLRSTDSTFTASNDFLLPHSISSQRPKAQRVRILFWGTRSAFLCKFRQGNVRKRYKNVDTLGKKKKKKDPLTAHENQNPVSWLMCVSFDSTKSSSSLFYSHRLAQVSTLRKIICSGSPQWMNVASDCK